MGSALTFTIVRFLVLLSITKATAAAEPLKCENGGVSSGATCTCPDFTDGTYCQNIKDIIDLGKDFKVTMKVYLTVDYNYTIDLTNQFSEEYKEFKKVYDEMLQSLLHGRNWNIPDPMPIPDNGKVRVIHDVIFTLQYNDTRKVLEQYEDNYGEVSAALQNNLCRTRALCIRTYSTEAIRPLSEYERCGEKISPEFIKFFDPVVYENGLACMSNCLPRSPNRLDCNSGSCQLKDKEGPQCFCPRTDLYIYTNSRCEGAILLAALYGGVGAAIGVLAIVGVVLGVFLYRKKYYY